MKMAHKDDYIIHKNIKRDDESGTVTLEVSFRSAENPKGRNIKTYTDLDARRWLTEGGVEFGELLQSCKATNYLGGNATVTTPRGVWVFSVPVVITAPTPTRTKTQKVKNTLAKEVDTTVQLTDEFDGLNYDGDTATIEPTAKKTNKKRTRKPRK